MWVVLHEVIMMQSNVKLIFNSIA